MADTKGIRAGRAFVELFADDSKLASGLRRASAKLKAFGAATRDIGLRMAGLGAAVIAPLAGAAKMFANTGASLWDMSKRTGVSVEALSVLGYAAGESGTDMESLEKAVRKMQRTIVQAASGSSSAQEALARLGLTVADLAGLKPEDQFKLIADRLDGISNPTQKAAAAIELFGRSGTALLPMIEGGAAALDAYQAKARKLGLVMSGEDARSAKRFSIALDDLWNVLKRAVVTIGAGLAPALSAVAKWITTAVVAATQWVRSNSELVLTVLKVAAAIAVAGVALVGISYAMKAVSVVFGIFPAILSIVGTAFSVLGGLIGGLLSPIGLVIGGIATLGVYMLYSTGAGGKALGWLGERFGQLKDEALTSFEGISDALAAGDIGMAAGVLWATLKMWWTKGTGWIQEIWLDALLWVKTKFAEAWGGIRIIFSAVAHGLTVAWIETTSFLSKLWTDFTGWVVKSWTWAGLQLQKLWNWLKGVFDSSFDAEAANKEAQKAFDAKKTEIEQEAAAKKQAVEEQRKKDRDAESKDFNDSLKRIVDETEARKDEFKREHDRKTAAANDDVEKARKEWQDAVKAASEKRKAKEAEGGPGKPQSPDDLLEKLKGKMAGVGDAIDVVAKRTIDVIGTFNPAAILGLQAGKADDRIVNATERTAAGVDGLRRDVRNNQAEFE